MTAWAIVACVLAPIVMFVLPVYLIERACRPGICPSCGQRGVNSRDEFTSAKYSIDLETCYLCGFQRRRIS